MNPETIVYAAIGGALFSMRGYLKKYPYGEEFDWNKFIATMLIGTVIAAGAILAGDPLSAAEFEIQIAAYAGLVALVEGVVKAVARYIEENEVRKVGN